MMNLRVFVETFCENVCMTSFKGGLLGLRLFLVIESPLKMMKNAFHEKFHLKSFFCSQDIYVFVFIFWSCRKMA